MLPAQQKCLRLCRRRRSPAELLPAEPNPAGLIETAKRLGANPGRCVPTGLRAGRNGGFALVIAATRTAMPTVEPGRRGVSTCRRHGGDASPFHTLTPW